MKNGRLTGRALPILALASPLLALLTASPAAAAPLISLSPTAGAVGTRVTLAAEHFESYIGDTVTIFFDSTEIAALSVPEPGSFTLAFTVPAAAAPGNHEVFISNPIFPDNKLVIHRFTVTATALKLDIAQGITGTAVAITGAGFYSGRPVTINYHNRTTERVAWVTASDIGEFSYTLTIPGSTAGGHLISAENNEGNSASAEFEVIPWTTINLTAGAVGDLLTVRGTGFGYRAAVSIFLGPREMARPSTSEYGAFEVSFNVPDLDSGTYDVKSTDDNDNTHRLTFTITAGINLDLDSGAIGTLVTLRGSGFRPRVPVTVSYDAAPCAAVTTDEYGGFTAAFRVPVCAGGSHLVTATDGTTARQLTFTVESAPPPAPEPLLPVDNSTAGSLAYFSWVAVTDPSQPVVYSLQIAADQNFASPVLEKKWLTQTEYTLDESEKLTASGTDSLYFWRLRATDSASNQGPWSLPRSFYIAAPPAPALLLPEPETRPPARQITFDWADATSPNLPVTYTLQIAADQEFSEIILEKTGLLESAYTLTEEEQLASVSRQNPYYWRVRVVDGAANRSAWTPWRPFYTGASFALPGWLRYTLIALGGAFAALFLLRMRRRAARRQEERFFS